MLKSFNQFIKEARRNPEKNQKVSAFDALEKHSKDPNIFISFVKSTKDFEGGSKNLDSHKLGINPKSEFETPNGIYSYPLSIMWDSVSNSKNKTFQFPYASEYPYIYVFRSNGNLLNFAHYSRKLYLNHVEMIEKMFYNITNKFDIQKSIAKKLFVLLTSEAKGNALIDILPSYFMNLTRWMSLVLETKDIQIDKKDENVYHFLLNENKSIMFHIKNRFISLENSEHDDVSNPNKWNWVFRQLGIDGLLDSKGEELIHINEPIQAVFFSKKAIKVIDVISNKIIEISTDKLNKLKNKIESKEVEWRDLPENLIVKVLARTNIDISKTNINHLKGFDESFYREILKYDPEMLRNMMLKGIQIPEKVSIDYLQIYFDDNDFKVVINNQTISEEMALFIVSNKPVLFEKLYDKIKSSVSNECLLKLIRISFHLQYKFILENIKIDLTKIPDYEKMIEETIKFRPRSIISMKRANLKIP